MGFGESAQRNNLNELSSVQQQGVVVLEALGHACLKGAESMSSDNKIWNCHITVVKSSLTRTTDATNSSGGVYAQHIKCLQALR